MNHEILRRSLPATCVAAALTLACLAAAPDRGVDVADAVVETFRQRNGTNFKDWPMPQAVVVVTGELDGYIEPCGCTGK